MKTIGLILNPVAGVGGPAGLKGSDGVEIQRLARELGIHSAVQRRASVVLERLASSGEKFRLLSAPGEMGETAALAADLHPEIVGIYRLTMKTDSDNFRASSILGIMERLQEANVKMVIYEPTLQADEFLGCEVFHNLQSFKEQSDLIVANRYHTELKDVMDKVYTRDIYQRD